MFDEDKLRLRIGVIEENLVRLETIRSYSFEDFQADFLKVEATKHLLQVAIEAMVDICAHITARLRIRPPENGAALVKALGKVGLLPGDHVKKYVQMIKFRNLLVHLYADVDDRRVYDILQNHLGDFHLFIADTWAIVQKYTPTAQD
ncbi:MAG: hypothetical protein A2Z04_03580 [Chloroflexi bacterium RBG_16_57_9]|nr:MAG: hypothetical protein A2Z04_03580 [Chloroflexi bacterium RBG_16_57_9]